jgi:cytoskeletal protein CcmA (bactofilin family)
MFKKDGSESSASQPHTTQTSGGRTPVPRKGGGPAMIGPSITIKGDVSGDEDLVIQGRVEGKVNLGQHNVTIGPDGRVKADVHGRTVVVEGEVEGDLRAQEQIILRQTAKVQGSIAAPRVSLDDGAVFRGAIEMDASGKPLKPAAERAAPKNDVAAEVDRSGKLAPGSGNAGKTVSA